jgi:hypothetical protein
MSRLDRIASPRLSTLLADLINQVLFSLVALKIIIALSELKNIMGSFW